MTKKSFRTAEIDTWKLIKSEIRNPETSSLKLYVVGLFWHAHQKDLPKCFLLKLVEMKKMYYAKRIWGPKVIQYRQNIRLALSKELTSVGKSTEISKIRIYLTPYVCTEQIFDSRPCMYSTTKYFWQNSYRSL